MEGCRLKGMGCVNKTKGVGGVSTEGDGGVLTKQKGKEGCRMKGMGGVDKSKGDGGVSTEGDGEMEDWVEMTGGYGVGC